MKPKTQLTKEHKNSSGGGGATKNLLTKMAPFNSFPSLTLVDTHPTHFSTPDSKSCRNLTIFGINNGLGQTVLAFKDKKDRAAYIDKSKLVKRIQRRGGRVLKAEFEVELKPVLKLIPPSYKSPRYKQLVEIYTSTRNSWGPQERSLGGLRSLLEKPKRCKDKTRTFACFFHLQELAAIWEMVLHDHMRGKCLKTIPINLIITNHISGGGMHTSALMKMVENIVCPNHLSEMVIAQVKELIASVIMRMKMLKKEEEEKEDDDTDEGIEEDAIFETGKENPGGSERNETGEGEGEDACSATIRKIQDLMNKTLQEIEVLGQIVKSNTKAVKVNAASIKDAEKNVKNIKTDLAQSSDDEEEEEEDFTVLSSLNPVIINIESDVPPVERRDPGNPARRIPSFPQADFGNIINIE